MTAPAGLAGIRLGEAVPATLVFVELLGDGVQVGDWVIVEADGTATLGHVIVSPDQVVERAPRDSRRAFVRQARAAERPRRRSGAGAALLESLGLPDSATWSAGRRGVVPASEQ